MRISLDLGVELESQSSCTRFDDPASGDRRSPHEQEDSIWQRQLARIVMRRPAFS